MQDTRSTKLPVTAAILAGGRSMRMGVDKTLLPLDGEALLARVVGVMGDVCARTLVVTNRPEGVQSLRLPEDVRVLSDEVPYQGPLGGLVTALAAAEDDWVLAVAADMPFVSPAVVRALWSMRDNADAVVPVTEKGPEPLLALYSKRCLPVARRVLASGRRRLVAVFRDVRAVEVSVESIRKVDPNLGSFVNVNTPGELDSLRRSLLDAAAAPRGEDESFQQKGSTKGTMVGGLGGEERCRPARRVTVIEAVRREARRMPVERPMTLHLNDREIATIQATPRDLEDMAIGFFTSEGLISDREALVGVDVDHRRGLVYVSTKEEVPGEDVYRSRFVTSGCGKGVTFSSVEHARGLSKLPAGPRYEADLLYDLMGRLARSSPAYRETGGMHACGLARGDELVLVREDVGRHNTVDKVLGRAWLDGLVLSEMVMLTTGRVSYEMAVKAGRAGVALVVSRTAVTDQAAEVASALGVTLAGYARGGRITVYTCPHRISSARKENP